MVMLKIYWKKTSKICHEKKKDREETLAFHVEQSLKIMR